MRLEWVWDEKNPISKLQTHLRLDRRLAQSNWAYTIEEDELGLLNRKHFRLDRTLSPKKNGFFTLSSKPPRSNRSLNLKKNWSSRLDPKHLPCVQSWTQNTVLSKKKGVFKNEKCMHVCKEHKWKCMRSAWVHMVCKWVPYVTKDNVQAHGWNFLNQIK